MENIKSKDLRVRRTHKALLDAMNSLLSKRSFNSITVYDLCNKALVSRAAFYAHFRDKYDLLEYFLHEIKEKIFIDVYNYERLERDVNNYINQNKRIIANVLTDANLETLGLLRGFMSQVAALFIKRKLDIEDSLEHIVLYNFIIGGLINQLAWIVEKGYPIEVSMMNEYLYKMLEMLTVWDADQENIMGDRIK